MNAQKIVIFQRKIASFYKVLDSKICFMAPHVGLSGMAVQEFEKSKHSKIFYWRGKMI